MEEKKQNNGSAYLKVQTTCGRGTRKVCLRNNKEWMSHRHSSIPQRYLHVETITPPRVSEELGWWKPLAGSCTSAGIRVGMLRVRVTLAWVWF